MSVHDYFRLRVITVSARSGLAKHGETDAHVVRLRADRLLADLERDVRSNGADEELLRRIGEARVDFRNGP